MLDTESIIKDPANWQNQMYAIIHKPTGKFLFGTDWESGKPKNRNSEYQAITFPNYATAAIDYNTRECTEEYEIVPVELVKVQFFKDENISRGVHLAIADKAILAEMEE